jgi:uncharacterized protein (UPF0371 family)
VKYLNAPHIGGRQIDRSVEDVLIQCAVTALANEQGADALKSQRGVSVLPRLEIILGRVWGQLTIRQAHVVDPDDRP